MNKNKKKNKTMIQTIPNKDKYNKSSLECEKDLDFNVDEEDFDLILDEEDFDDYTLDDADDLIEIPSETLEEWLERSKDKKLVT